MNLLTGKETVVGGWELITKQVSPQVVCLLGTWCKALDTKTCIAGSLPGKLFLSAPCRPEDSTVFTKMGTQEDS